MRGLYSVAASVFADRGEDTKTPADFGCIVLAVRGATQYLHSASNPNTALEDAGGTLIADDWAGFKRASTASVNDAVFRTRVERQVEGRTVELFIPRRAVKQDDTSVAEWLPPHKFLGDPDPDPVP